MTNDSWWNTWMRCTECGLMWKAAYRCYSCARDMRPLNDAELAVLVLAGWAAAQAMPVRIK